jgi:hypothetical protein
MVAHAQAPAPVATPQPPPASSASPEPAAIPEYKVEIVLFAYRDFDRTEERFDHRVLQPALAADSFERRPPPVFDDQVLESLTSGNTVPSSAPAAAPFRFRLLEPEELSLRRQYEALERIDAYVPLAHSGWVQQGLPENEAHELDLALLGVQNPRGTLRLHLSRFLHLTVDLTYQDDRGPLPQQPFGDSVLAELPLAPRYTLHAGRQVPRSGELHYFDHPAFGLLVLVAPLPANAEPVVPRSQPAA